MSTNHTLAVFVGLLLCDLASCGDDREQTSLPANRFSAYIANAGEDTVSQIDTAADMVTKTIAVGHAPYAVAVSPDGAIVYVSGDTTVSIIDARVGEVIDTVAAGGGGIAVDSNGRFVYVAGIDAMTSTEHVWVIDSFSRAVVDDIVLGPRGHGGGALDLALSPDDTTLHVVTVENTEQHFCFSTQFDCRLIYHSIDTRTRVHSVFQDIRTALNPKGIALAPANDVLYLAQEVLQQGQGFITSLSAIPLTPTAPRQDIAVPNPFGVAVDATGTRVFVSSDTGQLYVVKDWKIETQISIGSNPRGVSLTPDGSKAYVVNSGDNTVSVIDAKRLSLIATVAVGSQPITLGHFIGPAVAQ